MAGKQQDTTGRHRQEPSNLAAEIPKLYMSAPLAVSAIKTNRTNIVGQGLQLKSTIDGDYLGMSRQEKERWQKDAEREFALWADSKFCDSTRVNNFYEIQQVACMSWLLNGDACVF